MNRLIVHSNQLAEYLLFYLLDILCNKPSCQFTLQSLALSEFINRAYNNKRGSYYSSLDNSSPPCLQSSQRQVVFPTVSFHGSEYSSLRELEIIFYPTDKPDSLARHFCLLSQIAQKRKMCKNVTK